MPMLHLKIANGLPLSIPGQTIKALKGASPELLKTCPAAKSTIFYLITGSVRTAALLETVTTVKSRLDQDRTVTADWVEVEDHQNLPFFFQVQDICAVTGLDPDAPLAGEPNSAGCSVKIDVEFAPGVAMPIYAKSDPQDVIGALEPAQNRP